MTHAAAHRSSSADSALLCTLQLAQQACSVVSHANQEQQLASAVDAAAAYSAPRGLPCRLASCFLGGWRELERVEDCMLPSVQPGMAPSKFGFCTESSGTLQVGCRVFTS